MDTRRFGVAQTAADMCQVTEENIMEFAERMNRFGEGVFSRLAEIKRQKLEAGESVVDLSKYRRAEHSAGPAHSGCAL